MNGDKRLLAVTRRHFFGDCGVGLGKIALTALCTRDLAGENRDPQNPMSARKPHFPPKARSVIFLFMAGGPSQFELFEFKPKLQEYDGKTAPEAFLKGKRFAFMDSFTKEPPKLLGTKRQFRRHGQSGRYMSELLPNLASVVDDLSFLSSIHTDNFNHAPAKIFLNTGAIRFGRPSMGSWVTYGLGSESADLPGFVVLKSGPRGPRAGALNWGSGFLPSAFQGVPFQGGGDPILNLSTPG